MGTYNIKQSLPHQSEHQTVIYNSKRSLTILNGNLQHQTVKTSKGYLRHYLHLQHLHFHHLQLYNINSSLFAAIKKRAKIWKNSHPGQSHKSVGNQSPCRNQLIPVILTANGCDLMMVIVSKVVQRFLWAHLHPVFSQSHYHTADLCQLPSCKSYLNCSLLELSPASRTNFENNYLEKYTKLAMQLSILTWFTIRLHQLGEQLFIFWADVSCSATWGNREVI